MKLHDTVSRIAAIEANIERVSEKEGTLRMQASGRWAVCRSDRSPVEIYAGDLFRIEVDGKLRVTRMVFKRFMLKGMLFRGQPGEFYSADGYWLRDGLRAAIGERD